MQGHQLHVGAALSATRQVRLAWHTICCRQGCTWLSGSSLHEMTATMTAWLLLM
jgi:hypothetical protein